MVNGFVKEGAMADKSILACVPAILEESQRVDEIALICDEHEPNAIEFESFPVHCLKDSKESQVIEELSHLKGRRIAKNSTNAWHVLDIAWLDQFDEWILCGCCTDICVLQLALSLKTWANQQEKQKQVIVLEKGCATYDAPNHPQVFWHQQALALMSAAGIERR